ncbi:MAG: ssl1498 family light-harvesting-like protein [Synechococcus sp.]
MPYTKDERGIINNFPTETKEQIAEPPTKKQMIQYALFGAIAVAFLGGIMWVAFTVS